MSNFDNNASSNQLTDDPAICIFRHLRKDKRSSSKKAAMFKVLNCTYELYDEYNNLVFPHIVTRRVAKNLQTRKIRKSAKSTHPTVRYMYIVQ